METNLNLSKNLKLTFIEENNWNEKELITVVCYFTFFGNLGKAYIMIKKIGAPSASYAMTEISSELSDSFSEQLEDEDNWKKIVTEVKKYVSKWNHKIVFDTIEQARGTVVSSIFYIATQIESKQLMDLLIEMEKDDFVQLFPEIKKSNIFEVDQLTEDDITEFLFDYNKLGFLAITNHPIHSNFTFKQDGEFESCSYSRGASYESYVYAETIDELLEKIEAKAEQWYNYDLSKHKKDNTTKTDPEVLKALPLLYGNKKIKA